MLQRCNLTPIIIFDGGYDKSESKLKTIFQRTHKRLSLLKTITVNQNYKPLLPVLACDVFFSVLRQLNIAFAVSNEEADSPTAAAANYYQCPVISNDSDFYLYDLHHGFIMSDSIETTVLSDTDSLGNEYMFLNCSIYHISEFLSCFPGVDKTVLPLFSALVGNDYVEAHEFHEFYSNTHMPKYEGEYLNVCGDQKKMVEILCWLRNNTLSAAISQVIQCLQRERREYIRSIIENTISSYQIHNFNLLCVINPKVNSSSLDRFITPCGESVPLEFTLKYNNGEYSPFFANVIVMHKVVLSPQIEDVSCLSSYKCCRAIRKIIYGILVRHDVVGNTCQSKKCVSTIEEWDRQEDRLQKEAVEPTFFLEGFGMLPTINEISSLKKEVCQLILTKTLGFELDFLLDLPHEWQLLIACFNYWLKNSMPRPTQSFVYALIINLIYCSKIKPNNCSKLMSKDITIEKPGEKYKTSVKSILSKVCQTEMQNVSNNLMKYLTNPSIHRGSPLILYFVHSYSQLQSCVMSIKSLNGLLGNYMKNPDLNRCLSGTLIYNLAEDISRHSNPKLFIAEILGRTVLIQLFTALFNKVCHGVPPDHIIKNEVPSLTPRKKHRCS